MTATARGERSVIEFARCLRIVFLVGKYTDISWGGGEVFCRGDFPSGELLMGRKVSRGDLSRGNSYRNRISTGEILYWGVLHGINSPEGIFYGSNFLVRVGLVFVG